MPATGAETLRRLRFRDATQRRPGAVPGTAATGEDEGAPVDPLARKRSFDAATARGRRVLNIPAGGGAAAGVSAASAGAATGAEASPSGEASPERLQAWRNLGALHRRAEAVIGKSVYGTSELVKGRVRWGLFSALLGLYTTIPALLLLDTIAFLRLTIGYEPLGRFSALEWLLLVLANLVAGIVVLIALLLLVALITLLDCLFSVRLLRGLYGLLTAGYGGALVACSQ
jgi:hypothetical protein